MSQAITIEEVDWGLATPAIVKNMVQKIDEDVRLCKTKLDTGWLFFQRSYIESALELHDMARNKVDRTFLTTFERSIMKFIEESTQNLEECEQDHKIEFKSLTQAHRDVIQVGQEAPEQSEKVRALENEHLIPALDSQIETLKRVQKYHNEAKNSSVQIQSRIEEIKNRIVADSNKINTVGNTIRQAHAEFYDSTKKYEQQLPHTQKKCDELLATIQQQNLDGEMSTYNSAMQALKQEQVALISKLELAAVDYKKAELDALGRRADELKVRQRGMRERATQLIAEAQARIMQKIQRCQAEMDLTHKQLAREASTKQEQIGAIIDRYFTNNRLQQVGQRITAAQREWSEDVQFFRERYIQGELQDVQTRIAETYEKGLFLDAANVLHQAEMLAKQMCDRLSEQRETQERRKANFAREMCELDEQFHSAHTKALKASTARVEDIQQAVRRVGEALGQELERIDELVGNTEFLDEICQKLDKADVDIAFSVTCPEERYQPNQFVPTEGMSTTRVGASQLNLSVNGKLVSDRWVRNDKLLLEVERVINKLGFGCEEEPPSSSGARTRKAQQLQRRARSAKRAYGRRRPWCPKGIDLDEYIESFQHEFGRQQGRHAADGGGDRHALLQGRVQRLFRHQARRQVLAGGGGVNGVRAGHTGAHGLPRHPAGRGRQHISDARAPGPRRRRRAAAGVAAERGGVRPQGRGAAPGGPAQQADTGRDRGVRPGGVRPRLPRRQAGSGRQDSRVRGRKAGGRLLPVRRGARPRVPPRHVAIRPGDGSLHRGRARLRLRGAQHVPPALPHAEPVRLRVLEEDRGPRPADGLPPPPAHALPRHGKYPRAVQVRARAAGRLQRDRAHSGDQGRRHAHVQGGHQKATRLLRLQRLRQGIRPGRR